MIRIFVAMQEDYSSIDIFPQSWMKRNARNPSIEPTLVVIMVIIHQSLHLVILFPTSHICKCPKAHPNRTFSHPEPLLNSISHETMQLQTNPTWRRTQRSIFQRRGRRHSNRSWKQHITMHYFETPPGEFFTFFTNLKWLH